LDWKALKPKVVIKLINPGAGATLRDDQDSKFKTLLHDPALIILERGDAARFAPRIKEILPSIKIESVLHYAHREGYAAQNKDMARVRSLLAGLASIS
jgi:hypothetical protein